jgi:hypothetical protein
MWELSFAKPFLCLVTNYCTGVPQNIQQYRHPSIYEFSLRGVLICTNFLLAHQQSTKTTRSCTFKIAPANLITNQCNRMLKYNTGLNEIHFRYNEQLMFVRSRFAKAEKYIHTTWWEADITTHVQLPPSLSVRAPRCTHTGSAVLLTLTFYPQISVLFLFITAPKQVKAAVRRADKPKKVRTASNKFDYKLHRCIASTMRK